MKSPKINWQKVNNLLPVIVQDEKTNEVLMLAYMNEEALNLSLKTKFAHYFSRTKERIWKKGESSGHTQAIKEFWLDCDNDTLLLKVEQKGVACHTGRATCFFQNLENGEISQEIKEQIKYDIIDKLSHIIDERKLGNSDKSYVSSLFKKGENAILKKVAEEAAEFCFACKDKNKDEIVYEAADLLFHSLVALSLNDTHYELVKNELKRRFGQSGIDEKNSRND